MEPNFSANFSPSIENNVFFPIHVTTQNFINKTNKKNPVPYSALFSEPTKQPIYYFNQKFESNLSFFDRKFSATSIKLTQNPEDITTNLSFIIRPQAPEENLSSIFSRIQTIINAVPVV